MQETELRIGNYVFVPSTNQTAEVTLIHKYIGVSVNNSLAYLSFEQIQSIPLTEEWLKKFEFKKQNLIKYCLLYTIKTKHRQYFSVSEILDGYEDPNELSLKEIKKYWSFDGNKYDVKIKYVHQLQNLYFALTSEELQLKN